MAKEAEEKFDPALLTLRFVSSFLLSFALNTGVLFLANPLPVLESNPLLTEVVAVVPVERESNKPSPQLPISANAS